MQIITKHQFEAVNHQCEPPPSKKFKLYANLLETKRKNSNFMPLHTGNGVSDAINGSSSSMLVARALFVVWPVGLTAISCSASFVVVSLLAACTASLFGAITPVPVTETGKKQRQNSKTSAMGEFAETGKLWVFLQLLWVCG